MRIRPSVLLFLIMSTSLVTWLQVGYISQQRMMDSMKDTAYWMTKDRAKREITFKLSPARKPLQIIEQNKQDLITTEKRLKYYNNFTNKYAAMGKPKMLQSTRNYLLPVLFFDVGPNNLYRVFKESIPIAMAMNRTIVVPPFHRHPRMENFLRKQKRVKRDNVHVATERVVNVPIFDQTYSVSLESNPDKTFDMKSLKYTVPVETMERFSQHCNNRVDSVLICGDVDQKRIKGIQLFWNTTKLKWYKKVKIDNLRDVAEDKIWKIHLKNAMDKISKDRCAALVIGRRCLGQKETWLKSWKTVAPFVKRPVPVKILAKEFIENVFKSEKYVAIHWRYDQIDWNDMCKDSRPKAARNRNAKICDLSLQLGNDDQILYHMGSKISSFMREKGATKAYIAYPPQMNETMHRLRQHTPGLYTVYDVKEYAAKRYNPNAMFETNYMISFLEQEICYLSNFFLASPLSSWSQTVLLDLMGEDRQTYASVLDILADEYQGLPKLTWLFPEGSWG